MNKQESWDSYEELPLATPLYTPLLSQSENVLEMRLRTFRRSRRIRPYHTLSRRQLK